MMCKHDRLTFLKQDGKFTFVKRLSVLLMLAGCFVAFSEPINGQSLSFNQVLNISSVEDTVPAGKVWKVESIWTNSIYQYSGTGSCSGGTQARELVMNGNIFYLQADGVGYGSSPSVLSGSAVPFWLPAGSRLRTSCSQSLLSVIEFNLVP